jgi:hypothetical protein
LGRYGKGGDILSASCPQGASATWKAIIKGREVLKKGLIRKIGNGRTTEIWHDQWVAGTPSMKPMGRASEEPVSFVFDLLEEDSNRWDTEKVERIFFSSRCGCHLKYAQTSHQARRFLGLGLGEVRFVLGKVSV